MNKLFATCAAAIMCFSSVALCEEGGYVKTYAYGFPNPIGPTGMYGHQLNNRGDIPPLIVVDRIALGSPAEGIVVKDDLVVGVNGSPFAMKSDPRIALGYAMIDSESNDGVLRLMLKRRGNPLEVSIQLDRIPDYSPTWPLDCKRTDTMLMNACEYLSRQQMPEGVVPADEGYIGQTQAGLLWLAYGEPKYMENARRSAYWYMGWLQERECQGEGIPWGPWGSAYGGIFLAEYYMMTGDRGILPGIELLARIMADGQMPSGGYTHGFYDGLSAGYGELSLASMACYTSLLMAKDCGVAVDKTKLRQAEAYFEKFAPPLVNRYGDHMYETQQLGYDPMNGKVGGLAVSHFLNGKDTWSQGYAIKAARSMNEVEAGHTGHFFNILWTPVGASMAPAKEYRKAMDQIGWYYSYARTARGGFECLGTGGKYREMPTMTTAGIGLGLAAPRHHLRIFGAPESVFVIESLPAELAAARTLHQENKWEEAIAAVDAFMKERKPNAETMQLANQLRNKARYMQAGADLAMDKLTAMSAGGRLKSRAYEVTQMLEKLKPMYDENDPRLKTVISNLPEPWRNIWSRSEWYHEGITLLRRVRTEYWFPYSRMITKVMPDVELPAWDPEWTPIVATTKASASRKVLMVQSLADAPKGWADAAFDDSDWSATVASKRKNAPEDIRLTRMTFNYDGPSPRRLRIQKAGRRGINSGTKVYLNGTLVMRAESPLWDGLELFDTTRFLLRQGVNTLAFSSPISKKGHMTECALEGVMPPVVTPFAWTTPSGRDAELRELTARHRPMKPYYNAQNDTRTPEALMQAITAEPSFMPDIFYALQRFKSLALPLDQQKTHISALLKSTTWGGRWAGAYWVNELMTSINGSDLKRLPQEEQAQAQAANADARAMCQAFAEDIIELLSDPHPFVRCQAAQCMVQYGESAKSAIPQLVALLKDVDGQTWYTRLRSLEALMVMPLDEETKQTVEITALSDPNSYVRRAILDRTFQSGDKATVARTAQAYKSVLIQQVFDAPHGMATPGDRSKLAKTVIDQLAKDDILTSLPRFLNALKQPGGGTAHGSMAILASLGGEVVDELKVLAADKDQTVRINALETLQRIALSDAGSPELIAFVKRGLDAEDVPERSWLETRIKKLLKSLDQPADKKK